MTGLLLCLSVVLLSGCNEVDIQSHWRSSSIVMDGSRQGWSEDVRYLDKDSQVLVTIMNDKRYLYIRMTTRNETTKRLFLRTGFTLWIDDSGGTNKKFGIQFPLPRQSYMPGSMPDYKPRTGIEDQLEDSRYNLAILHGDGGRRETMPVRQAEEREIFVNLTMEQSHLVYELKAPLDNASDTGIIGVKFESGKLERPSGRGGGGGKGGGRGGGRGGGGRGKGGQYSGSPPQAIEVWAMVHLADNKVL